jgi:hypothetical protein
MDALHACHRRSGVARHQGLHDAGFAAGAARLDCHDTSRHGFGSLVFAGHVVQTQPRFHRRQMLGHGLQPALGHRNRSGAAHRFDGQPRQPQVVQLRVGVQQRIKGVARLLLPAQALPGHQQQLQGLAVGRGLFQHRQQVFQCLQRLPGLQLQLAGQAAHGRGVALGRGQDLAHGDRSAVGVALADLQLHQHALQRGHRRIEVQHAAERLLGEGQHVLAQVGKAQRIQHPRIVGHRLGSGRQQRHGALALAPA